MSRRILHIDFNCFYASVECFLNPAIREIPVAVAGEPEKRHGIILAKNELAKKQGVKTGEAIWQAKQKCPGLLLVKPHYEQYIRFSRMGREIYNQYSDLVEGFGLDENWVDVTGVTGTFAEAVALGETIRERVKEELGITVSVGVADNKIFAKLGSDRKKPDGLTALPPQSYPELIWPLPVEELLFVGPATKEKLRRYGITTIGQMAAIDPAIVKGTLGKWGYMLHTFACGQDDSPVAPIGTKAPIKSIGNSVTAPRDLISNEDISLTFLMLAESVSARLREQGFRASTVQISVRDGEFASFTRQKKLREPTDLTEELHKYAMALFLESYDWQKGPIRSIGIAGAELVTAGARAQLSLLESEESRLRREQAERTVDSIRTRFGYGAILRCRMLSDTSLGLINPREEHIIFPAMQTV